MAFFFCNASWINGKLFHPNFNSDFLFCFNAICCVLDLMDISSIDAMAAECMKDIDYTEDEDINDPDLLVTKIYFISQKNNRKIFFVNRVFL